MRLRKRRTDAVQNEPLARAFSCCTRRPAQQQKRDNRRAPHFLTTGGVHVSIESQCRTRDSL